MKIYIAGNAEPKGFASMKHQCIEDENDDFQIQHVACGWCHCVIVTNKNRKYSVGYGKYGQLGLGHFNNELEFKSITFPSNELVKMLQCGFHSSAIVTEANELYICGVNHSGMSGLGDRVNRNVFTKVNVPSDGIITHVAMGCQHSCIVLNHSELYVSGSNLIGQGLPNTNVLTRFELVTDMNKQIKQICCGFEHVVILTSDSEIYFTGTNRLGQLAYWRTLSKGFQKCQIPFNRIIQDIACGVHSTILRTESGLIYSFRYNVDPQSSTMSSHVELIDNNECTVKQLCSTGSHYAVVMTRDHQLLIDDFKKFQKLSVDILDSEILKIVKCGYRMTAVVTENYTDPVKLNLQRLQMNSRLCDITIQCGTNKRLCREFERRDY
jgi:alpha-tubulin suppressor-like RCC1 family protein